MSRQSRKEADNAKANMPARYEVGYGKPPVEHHFQKGRSSNPRGLPKGAKGKPA